jgi:hypothetical protein
MNKTENNTIQLSELIYLAYFTVMFGARAIGLYEGMLPYNMMLVAGMLLFLLKIAMTRHTFGEYLLIGVLLFISLIVYYNTGEKGLLLYFTMMLGMKNVSLKRVMKWAAAILSISFTVLVFLSVFGLKQDITYLHDRAGFGQVLRHSLGYPYPNTLFTTYIVLMVLIMYVLGKQTKKQLIVTSTLMFLGAVYIYLYSCSNTGLIVATFYLFANLWLQLRNRLSMVEKLVLLIAYPGCALLSIVGPLVTSGSLFQIMDKVLHNRWAYSYYYLTTEPVTLFGTRFGETPNDNYMIDSSFLYSFLQIGVIPFLIVTTLMVGMIVCYVKRDKRIELAMIISFCVLGLSDPFFFNLSYKNLMFLFVGELWYLQTSKPSWFHKGLLEKEIYILRCGERSISLETPFYGRIKAGLCMVRDIVTDRENQLLVLFLGIWVIVTTIILACTWSSNVTGAVDRMEEWEYFRRILSTGLFSGVFGIVISIIIYWKKGGMVKDENYA